MAQLPEDKKSDLSYLPRGAIGIRGLPVSRNARLPSIRSPRDLTLGSQPKRTFVPNIPVRREKRATAETDVSTKLGKAEKSGRQNISMPNERGRGRGRARGQIIQTQGSVFGDGIGMDSMPRKDRPKDSYSRIGYSSSGTKAVAIKKEKIELDVSAVGVKLDSLLRDDFIDDEDDDMIFSKPTIFPMQDNFQKEAKQEKKEDIKNLQLDNMNLEQIAKFIKKEKDVDEEGKQTPVIKKDISVNDIPSIFKDVQPQLLLLQFPQCVTISQKTDEADLDSRQKGQSNVENNDQNSNSVSLSSLSEGCVGKLQLLKSGRARLVLNSVNFDLDSITPLHAKHEVVSVRTNSNTGDLIVVGNMEQKLKFAPDVESLLS